MLWCAPPWTCCRRLRSQSNVVPNFGEMVKCYFQDAVLTSLMVGDKFVAGLTVDVDKGNCCSGQCHVMSFRMEPMPTLIRPIKIAVPYRPTRALSYRLHHLACCASSHRLSSFLLHHVSQVPTITIGHLCNIHMLPRKTRFYPIVSATKVRPSAWATPAKTSYSASRRRGQQSCCCTANCGWTHCAPPASLKRTVVEDH